MKTSFRYKTLLGVLLFILFTSKQTEGVNKPNIDCSFDGGICNFFEITYNDSATFLWTVQNSRSLKDLGHTGPENDKFGSEDGKFIFVSGNEETKTPHLQTGMMSSKLLGGTNCLTFDFDLSDQSGIDVLEVLIHLDNQSMPIWSLAYNSLTSSERNTWKEGSVQIQVPENLPYEIEFQASHAVKGLGYVALDNIKLKDNGQCPITPEEARPKLKIPNTTAAPAYIQCEFEEDFCDWTPEAPEGNPNFVWKRETGQSLATQSIRGPLKDYTGDTNKFFAFSTSSSKRSTSDTTVLMSRTFVSEELPEECVEFHFSVMDPTFETWLELNMVYEDGLIMTVWRVDSAHTQTDTWMIGRVFIVPLVTATYRVELVAGYGEHKDGFVAVDNFIFNSMPETCVFTPQFAEPSTPTTISSTIVTEPPDHEIQCEFEIDLCHWEASTTDESSKFIWERTDSALLHAAGFEGPDEDHHGSESGHFIYVSANHEVTATPHVTKLFSPYLNGHEHPIECLSFWFSMAKNTGIEALQVRVREKDSDKSEIVWNFPVSALIVEGLWFEGQVELRAPDDPNYYYRVEFDGIHGNHTRGYVAFDDVQFIQTDECMFKPTEAWPTTAAVPTTTTETAWTGEPTEPPDMYIRCEFETDYCQWEVETSAESQNFAWSRMNAEGLEELAIQGPPYDHDQFRNHFFVLASANENTKQVLTSSELVNTGSKPVLAGGLPYRTTLLKSPFLKSQEHPEECLEFWFFLEDDTHQLLLEVNMVDEFEKVTTLWSLPSADMPLHEWVTGRVKIVSRENAEQYRIEFVSKKGEEQVGFVAIDDVRFNQLDTTCTFTPEIAMPTTTTAMPTTIVTEPPMDKNITCEFESDLCSWEAWSNDDNGQFIWQRHNGLEISELELPGPQKDHLGSSEGFFIYVSARLETRPEAFKTRLISPYFIGENHPIECLSFWFSMEHTEGIERLQVLFRQKDHEEADIVWSLPYYEEAESDLWVEGRVEVKAPENPDYIYRIEIEAIHGKNSNGYVAFDGVNFFATDGCDFIPKSAWPVSSTTTQVPTPVPTEPPDDYIRCEFTDDLCNYEAHSDDELDRFLWNRTNAQDIATAEKYGPTTDHLGSDTGYFLLVNSNLEIKDPPMTTELISPMLIASQHPKECLGFWFIITQKSGIERMQVIVRDSDESSRVVWSLPYSAIEEGDHWIEGRVEIMSKESVEGYRVVFQVIHGETGYASYVALDDITFKAAECTFAPAAAWPAAPTTTMSTPIPTEPPDSVIQCEFEVDYCNWSRYTTAIDVLFVWTRYNSATLNQKGLPGPASDHLGNLERYFVYASPSMAGSVPFAHITFLQSPFLNGQEHPVECLKFWFALKHDGGIKSLDVYQKDNLDNFLHLWSYSHSSQEDEWIEGQIPLLAIEEPGYEYRIEFHALRGETQVGYVSLDDIIFAEIADGCTLLPPNAVPTLSTTTSVETTTTEATTTATEATTTTTPDDHWAYCTFQDDLCGYIIHQHQDTNYFFFERVTSEILVQKGVEGPSRDHTGSLSKYFLFTSATYAPGPGAVSMILSPVISDIPKQCFEFRFQMVPHSGIEALTVYLRDAEGVDHTIWDLKDVKLDFWEIAQVEVDFASSKYQVHIQAKAGGVVEGYVAVDDFIFGTSTSCKTIPSDAKPGKSFGDCSFQFNLCKWNIHSTSSNGLFPWERKTGAQLEEEQIDGPKTDHNDHKKQYFLIASPSLAPAAGDVAILESPTFSGIPVQCFNFYFSFLSDQSVQSLTIYMQAIGEGSEAVPIWRITDHEYGVWLPGRVLVRAEGDYKLLIEMVRGEKTELGWATFDDFEFLEGDIDCRTVPTMADPTTTTTTTPATTQGPSTSPGDCTFETDTCQWVFPGSVSDQTFFWNRTNAEELTAQGLQGPGFDHVGNKKHFFAWSSPTYAFDDNSVAIMESPIFMDTKAQCFDFYFSFPMDNSFSYLEIAKIETTGEGTRIPVWKVKKNNFNNWEIGRLYIESEHDYRLQITAKKGHSGNHGWVALDEFVFLTGQSSGRCHIEPPLANPEELTCNFEKGDCNWVVTADSDFKWIRLSGQDIIDFNILGPQEDHDGNKNTVFLHANGAAVTEGNQMAMFESPYWNAIQHPDECFHFWFSFSAGNGIKSIFIESLDKHGEGRMLWHLNEVPSEGRWHEGQVRVKAGEEKEYMLRVVAVRGDDTTGFVSVDDFDLVELEQCATLPQQADPTTMDCDFEKDFCTWTITAETGFIWELKTGQEILDQEINGPDQDHSGDKNSHFLNANGAMADHAEVFTVMQSERRFEETHQRECFHFWFSMSEGEGISRLAVELVDRHGEVNLLWEMLKTPEVPLWMEGQVPIKNEGVKEYQIRITAIRGVESSGYVAMDDIFLLNLEECPIMPPEADPNKCPEGKFTCNSGQCVDETSICNFKKDCSDGSDEHLCPYAFTFEDCAAETGEDLCLWQNEAPENLVWKVIAIDDELTQAHGPHEGGGHFLFLSGVLGPEGDYTDQLGILESPTYRDSAVGCHMAFSHYLNGDMNGGYLEVAIHEFHVGFDVPVEKIYPDVSESWINSVIQIGRRKGPFRIVFKNSMTNKYDAAIAIDSIELYSCALPDPTTEENCPTGSWKCANSACIANDRRCNGEDDCGDDSDENTETCNSEGFKIDKFEFEESSLFHNFATQSLDWKYGSGESGSKPFFDHSFAVSGKYVYIGSPPQRGQTQAGTQYSRFMTKSLIEKSQDLHNPCRVRFFVHLLNMDRGDGQFSVLLRHGNTETPLLTEYGGNANEWKPYDISLSTIQEPSYLIFETRVITEGGDVLKNNVNIALDDVTFTPQCIFQSTPTTPQPDTTPASPCQPNEFKCNNGECIAETKVCDFVFHCSGGEDEATCPTFSTFNDCNDNLNTCFWNEDFPDHVDFVAIGVKELVESGISPHGPFNDSLGQLEGGLLFLKADPDEPSYVGNLAMVKGPAFQNSSPKCILEFRYFTSGDTENLPLIPAIYYHELQHILTLDHFYPAEPGFWSTAVIGIGRQNHKFQLVFIQEIGKIYDAGIAIDDVVFTECQLKPPRDDCDDSEFHCEQTKACIPKMELCDLTDDCGDMSDETLPECQKTIQDSFEHDFNPFGLFHQDSPQADFKWNRGAGDNKQNGTGPPFDHTTYGKEGHYIFINSTLQNKDEKAHLVSPWFVGQAKSEESCLISMWYHMYGSGIGTLTVYLLAPDGASEVLDRHTGSMGNIWKKWDVFIPSRVDPFAIIIEAMVGEEPGKGDIAIDDVVFHEHCSLTEITSTTESTHSSTTSTTTTSETTTAETTTTSSHTTHHTTTTHKPTTHTTARPTTTPPITPEPKSDKKWTIIIVVAVILLLLILGVIGLIFYLKKTNTRIPVISSFLNPTYDQSDSSGQPIISLRDLSSREYN